MREVDTVQSRIEQVTVFASGARIRRIATLSGPVPERIRIGDLPVAVIDTTVRAEVDGPAVVTALRTGFTVPSGAVADEEPVALRAARVRQAETQAEVDRLERSIERLAHATLVVDDASDEAPAPWGAVLAARRALVAARAEREVSLREQAIAARLELDAAKRAYEVAAERDVRSGTARAAKLHETRKHVELDLTAAAGSGDVTIRIEYQVAAARWAPSYVARIDGDTTHFELRAVVAQATGEDWTSVALRLSTAEPDQFAELPELHAQKIGRRQAEPAKRGFRAPPAGADALYADYVARFPMRPSTRTGSIAPAEPEPDVPMNQVWDESSSRAKVSYEQQGAPRASMAPGGAAAPPPAYSDMPMPMPSRAKGGGIAGSVVGGLAGAVAAPFAFAAQSAVGKKRASDEGGGAMREQAESSASASAPASAPPPRLDYGSLVMAPPSSGQRGHLVPAPRVTDPQVTTSVAQKHAALVNLALPTGHVASWAHTYDYAFASDGMVDVASDGAWHSLALTARSGAATIRHVAVPREQSDVFRVATLTNPLEGPLLPGPIDVYDHGQFLVTSRVGYTPPGGKVAVGLGVDAAVKVARNTEFHEETAGMLRGALKLFHTISIEVENLSARAIELEVRERVPVKREGDDDIEVTLGKIEPAWERWTPDPDAPKDQRLRGAYRWRVEVAPCTKRVLRAAYEVKIAGKHELVGGNRRES